MNYSQRKHIERILADAPDRSFDPFSLRMPQRLMGMDVIESPDRPRYEMPEWLVPPREGFEGVRWEPKLRADTNRWALSFLGTVNMIPRGTVYMLAGNYMVMRPDDRRAAVMLTNCI